MTVDLKIKKRLDKIHLDDKERFDLRRYFSMFSIVIIVVLTIVLSALVYWNQKISLINYSTSTTETFAKHLTDRIYEDFIKANSEKYGYLYMEVGSLQHKRMDELSAQILKDYSDILKFKIFNGSGKIVYSTESENIGLMSLSGALFSALEGESGARLTRKHTVMLEEHTERGRKYEIDLLEVYIPIYKNINKTQTEIIGVFEIYKDISPLYSLMKSEFYKVPIMLIFAMGALYLFLLLVINNANSIINIQNDEIDKNNSELEEAQQRIKESIDEVIKHESFNVRFHGINHVKCWEVKKCVHIECPCYGEDELRCWQVAGTFCGGKVQGFFAKKYGDCMKCEVYKSAFLDRIDMIGESFNNMMILLENKHEELQLANEKLNTLVDIDPLTQIGNRRAFHKKMESIHLMSLRYNHSYSIVICDVDEFKLYNDTYGHQQGDYALVSVSNAMKEKIRKTDGVFRWGGEEFVIVLPEQSYYAALKVAEHLRTTILSLGISHEKSPSQTLTMSFGVASNNTGKVNYISWEAVLREADAQLYKAKAHGKNRVYPLISKSELGGA